MKQQQIKYSNQSIFFTFLDQILATKYSNYYRVTNNLDQSSYILEKFLFFKEQLPKFLQIVRNKINRISDNECFVTYCGSWIQTIPKQVSSLKTNKKINKKTSIFDFISNKQLPQNDKQYQQSNKLSIAQKENISIYIQYKHFDLYIAYQLYNFTNQIQSLIHLLQILVLLLKYPNISPTELAIQDEQFKLIDLSQSTQQFSSFYFFLSMCLFGFDYSQKEDVLLNKIAENNGYSFLLQMFQKKQDIHKTIENMIMLIQNRKKKIQNVRIRLFNGAQQKLYMFPVENMIILSKSKTSKPIQYVFPNPLPLLLPFAELEFQE